MGNEDGNFLKGLLKGFLIFIGITFVATAMFKSCFHKKSEPDIVDLSAGIFIICIIGYFAYRKS